MVSDSLQVSPQLGRMVQPEGPQSFAHGFRPDIGVLSEVIAVVRFEHSQVLGLRFFRERLQREEPLFPDLRIDGRAMKIEQIAVVVAIDRYRHPQFFHQLAELIDGRVQL